MQVDQAAPARCSKNIEVNAPAQVVWDLLSDIEHWPDWNRDVKSAHLQGALRPGTVFTWKTSSGTVTSVLKAVKPNHLVGWTGKALGINAVHVWRLEGRQGVTLVTSEESWDGWLPRLLRRYCEKLLATSSVTALERLKAAAESSQR